MSENTNKFYITTPIYYGNGLPHVGHFYTSTIANVIFKYYKIHGYESRFTTGIDENSQKAVLKAQEEGLETMDYLDKMAYEHKKVWDYFNIDYTDFIRTTEARHHKVVQNVLQHCYDKGDIYAGDYEGKYCIGCEAFKKDEDLVLFDRKNKKQVEDASNIDVEEAFDNGDYAIFADGDNNEDIGKRYVLICPDHLTVPAKIKEKNYFFKLSKYQVWMEEFYKAHPEFVIPDFRFNEVIAFVQRGLEDFSISRETNTFGIPLPFDSEQVTYVWFDALFNYYTSCVSSRGGDKDNTDFIDESAFWPASLHTVGKDIIRFHAIFWPAMLASYFDLGEELDGVVHFKESDYSKLPKQILTGGFFTVDGQKMSKSLGNVIEPVSYSEEYSKDLLTLYMLSAFPIGNDGDYDREEAIKLYNAKLANNLGNLVNRVVVLSLKLEDATLLSLSSEDNSSLITGEDAIFEMYQKYNLKGVLDACFENLDRLNKFADEMQPWVLIKEDEEKARKVLYTLAEGLRKVGLHLYPFFPEKMNEMFTKLGIVGYQDLLESGAMSELLERKEDFIIREKGNPLFKRFDV